MTKTSGTGTKPPIKDRKLLLIRDSSIQYPELWCQVYISGPPMDAMGFPELFTRGRCWKADKPEEADIVVFTGGPDVSPDLYGAKTHSKTSVDLERDRADLELYAKCYELGIPMIGVCRGAQFGHVMNGGILYQHVDGHNAQHQVWCPDVGRLVMMSSVHHQMCKENNDMDVLAWVSASKKRELDDDNVAIGNNHKDVEAFFYRDSCFLGVQGHPEYRGYHDFSRWFLDQVLNLILHNPDVECRDGLYRLKESVRESRKDQMISTMIKEAS